MKIFIFIVVLLTIFSSTGFADLNSDLDTFFSSYVSAGEKDGVKLNLVSYKAIKQDPDLYKKILDQLENYDLTTLKTTPETMAFWINAYNIGAIKMIIDHYPVKSITDIGWLLRSVWKIEIVNVGGKMHSLGQIEHEILRKMGDPAIHMAISCASVSCPNVLSEAYKAAKLRGQLESQARKFLSNVDKGASIDHSAKVLYLSSIFDWFKDDFKKSGGVVNYLKPYLPRHIQNFVERDKYQIKYIPYNWNLNGG
jgi:Protein of unknown function, DUF547